MTTLKHYRWTLFAVLAAAAAQVAEGAALSDPTLASASPANATTVPNITAQVSQRLLSDLVTMPVQNTTRISDNILGTAVRGTVKTQGVVFPLLVPNSNQGVVQLRFSGVSRSPNLVGQNGPATIYSSSVTNSNMWKTVIFNDKGIRHLPTEGQVQSQVNINGVSANRPLVERIARRRANGSRGQAQAATSARTKGELKQQIDRGAKEPLLTAQDYFANEFLGPLKERNASPKMLRFNSTRDHLQLAMQQLGRTEVAQPIGVPTFNPRHDLAFGLHESAVNSFYEVFYAGETMRDADWLKLMDTITGDEPAPLRNKSGSPRWSVTLRDKLPLELSFNNGGATIALHFTKLKIGDKQFETSFVVSARYQFAITSTGPQVLRKGDVEAEGEAGETSGELDDAISFLKAKFAGVFQPEPSAAGLSYLADDLVSKLTELSLVQLEARDGWLVLGYQLPQAQLLVAKRSAANVVTPVAVTPRRKVATPAAVASRPTAKTSVVAVAPAKVTPQATATPRVTKQDLDAFEMRLTNAAVKHEAARRALPYLQKARRGSCH